MEKDETKMQGNILSNIITNKNLLVFVSVLGLAFLFLIIQSVTPSPSNPELKFPPNGTLDISYPLTLSWFGENNESVLNKFLISIGSKNPIKIDALTINYQVFLRPEGGNWTKLDPINFTNSYKEIRCPLEKSLNPNTKYYWRIEAKNNRDKTTSGPIWTFTTKSVPRINEFNTSRNQVNLGDSVTLQWNVSNVNTISIRPNVCELQANEKNISIGTKTIPILDDTIYTLVANNFGWKYNESSVTVTIISRKPEIVEFKVEPNRIKSDGDSAVLSWHVNNVDTIRIEPAITSETLKDAGSLQVSPNRNTTYRLIAINDYGTNSSISNLTVLIQKPHLDFWPDKKKITRGESANLNWKISGADPYNTTLNGMRVDMEGSQPISPLSTEKYILMASNEAGTSISEINIEVSQCPVAKIENISENPRVGQGINFKGSAFLCPSSKVKSFNWYANQLLLYSGSPASSNINTSKIREVIENPGEYLIKFTVQDSNDIENTTTRRIYVRP